ncbi:Endonuclease/exonuclease/phosphatase,Reverse transcriptase domain [Cinara cedri]|uniref:Endonuclease/exonuclease/phosphatase,Reverse transcriptase domain n=1 Tax=Cinara cedri TaxID=506608 RepID=A0A5E4N505_9HEMI|nr:Endonuclease/exonuclease/phosphatase,Reverse transcriptase domain [Cinara cedri]
MHLYVHKIVSTIAEVAGMVRSIRSVTLLFGNKSLKLLTIESTSTINDIMYGNDLIEEFVPGKRLNKVPQVVIMRNLCSMIGTRIVRTLLQTGKLDNFKIEMERLKIDILGISEMRWNGQGNFISGDYSVIYSGGDNGRNGVSVILNKKWAQYMRSHISYDDRLILIKLKSVLNDITIIQSFMPITQANDEEVEEIYKKIEELINLTNSKENCIIEGLECDRGIQNSIFPENFKIAIIKPLFKGGDRKNISNYRPISMLFNFSKIFEKIIKTRLISYLEKNNLLSKNQYGFRPGISTENALYNATQFLYDSLDNGLKTIAVFIDLAKAFDTIHHNILLRLLPNFGITNKSLRWFKSYLSNRQQMVKLNDVISNGTFIEYGVPQGSVLGPILFILYINAVCDLNIDGKIVTYADDTCLLFSDISWEGVNLKATRGLNITYKCINELGLTMNSDKTTYMKLLINRITNDEIPLLIHNCKNQLTCNIQNCKRIFQISKIRYLGIIINNNLRWNFHIQNLVGKLRYSLHRYQSICQYGLLVWGGVKENFLKILQSNQNNVLRIK